MKINYSFVSRSLIAFLFVMAGVQKLMHFTTVSGYIGSLGIPLPVIVTALVIFIELPVALAFAWGYKTRMAGKILIAFTFLTIPLVHKDFFGADMVMVLKNIAIIGGIMAAMGCSGKNKEDCSCGTCSTCMAKK